MSYTEEVYKQIPANQINQNYNGMIDVIIATGCGSVSAYFAPGKDFKDIRAKTGSLLAAGSDLPTPFSLEIVNGNVEAARSKAKEYIDSLLSLNEQ